ncbi:unnamed protein product [Acanthoscelides obtectus]|uniref:Uncharacterized protein n=1 Tax=Acanthoscelides obtectus TaxID=200917 RepID=A0A9P0L3B3_ACAOB|nr:unnamed protein product [Acanthoscelides obtectus]CAK1674507.1 hypothetical protein AOBTE_LOCUS29642 [Acanthoscelides obtectus]
MVSDCRTRKYHPAVLVGGGRMCAFPMYPPIAPRYPMGLGLRPSW